MIVSVMRVRASGAMALALMLYLRALDGQHVREPDEAHLGRAVVRLAEVAEQAGGRRGGDDAAVALLAHLGEGRLGDVEGAPQVDVEAPGPSRSGPALWKALSRRMPALLTTMSTRAEGVDRGLHDGGAALGRGHRVRVGHGLAAGRLDLVDHPLGRALVAAGAVDRAAEVVHDHERAAGGEQQGVLAAEAAAGAGDDRHLAVEAEICHEVLLVHRCGRQRPGGP